MKYLSYEALTYFVGKVKGYVSDAIRTAINELRSGLKLSDVKDVTATVGEVNNLSGVKSNVQSQLDAKAPKDSAALTGTPTAPTAANDTNTDQIATTKFVKSAIAAIPSADLSAYATTESVDEKIAASEKKIFGDGELAEAFDTIKEIGDYLKDHDNVATAINDAIAKKADKTELENYYNKTAADGKFATIASLAGYVQTADITAISNTEIDELFK